MFDKTKHYEGDNRNNITPAHRSSTIEEQAMSEATTTSLEAPYANAHYDCFYRQQGQPQNNETEELFQSYLRARAAVFAAYIHGRDDGKIMVLCEYAQAEADALDINIYGDNFSQKEYWIKK